MNGEINYGLWSDQLLYAQSSDDCSYLHAYNFWQIHISLNVLFLFIYDIVHHVQQQMLQDQI